MGACCSSDEEGQVDLRLINKMTKAQHQQAFNAALQAVSLSSSKKLKLYVKIVEAVNLLCADDNGYSDPYVKVKVDDAEETKCSSSKRYKTLDPIYNSDMVFTLKNGDLKGHVEFCPTDYDETSANDELGYAKIPLDVLKEHKYYYGWINLFDTSKMDKRTHGKLYVRMVLNFDDQSLNHQENAQMMLHRVFLQERDDFANKLDRFESVLAAALKSGSQLYSSYGPSHMDSSLKVTCCSWNVGNAPPGDAQELQNWIVPGADVYAIGTQENTYKVPAGFASHEAHWLSVVEAALGPEYYMLDSANIGMGGQIWVHVFARKSIAHDIDIMQGNKKSEATGLGGVVNNKGGVTSAFCYKGTSMGFISSHLAAHQDMNSKRNDDFCEIISGLQYKGHRQSADVLSNFHHLFWMGDLNYRLDLCGDKRKPEKEAFDSLVKRIYDDQDQQKWKEFMEHDQLTQAIAAKEAYWRFSDAGPIRFRPSFKVKRAVEKPEYDPARCPSFCDRVLWHSQPGFKQDVKNTHFSSAEKVITGDHKPVYAQFEIESHQQYPAVDETMGTFSLTFEGLQGFDLPIGDITSSDPYLSITSPYLKGGMPWTNPYKASTLNPTWTASEMTPLVFPYLNRKSRVAKEFLQVSVIDHDDLSEHDLLCQGVISLSQFVGNKGKTVDFTLELEKNGRPAGRLEGKIKCEWELEGMAQGNDEEKFELKV